MVSAPRTLLLMVLFAQSVAEARMPQTPAEESLLYWRYLCRGSVQSEKVIQGRREFRCEGQGWSVFGPERSGKVEEIRNAGE